jgi:hypothetical protein
MGELGDPTRIIEVTPLVSPLPAEAPEEIPAELEPDHEREEVAP